MIMFKKFIAFIVFSVLSTGFLSAQGFEGEIVYERTYFWVNVNQHLPYLSEEEKDRMKLTYGKKAGWSSKYKLWAKDNQTLYTYDEDQPVESDWAWRQDEFVIFRDLNKRSTKQLIETLGRTYLIDEAATPPKWKILNEIKDVAGYICMKAETYDSIKDQRIVAWFTDQIPVDGGPEMMFGLPGMILELNMNQGSVIITALSVKPMKLEKGLPLPKKWKGKKIENEAFQEQIKKHITESIAAKRNPYWQIRY
ncbi:MAG TPA: GLPGLI family protein [Saprospiraceae bacterium]|nr:GLPGLI family protein [Saprospiraceae bacterium]MCC6687623.1 GLPGLI family protein [Saprospiraceae bacterium]HMX83663.1 GLPGLI family protein [Saprospiraceae bacterium]HNA94708.1 GLPGLI family protein [Saprospiraceae bacterium]HNE65306.1 GLPGLI family protein [Saprospiraceae bacterium]